MISHLQLSLTGRPSPVLRNRCAGRNLGDNVARGYITVDTVKNCTLRYPSNPGYFGLGGTGDATNDNVLWSDYIYLDQTAALAEGETLVFYGRYVNWTAVDNRKPLPTNFAVRYLNAPGSMVSSLTVWRDSKVSQAPFACPAQAGSRPSWFPLGQERIVIFDEQEHPQVPAPIPIPEPPPNPGLIPFPAVAQRIRVGSVVLPVPFEFGWLYLNLNASVVPAGAGPPADPAAAQAWVTAIMDASGRFSVGFDAIQLDRACNAKHSLPDFCCRQHL